MPRASTDASPRPPTATRYEELRPPAALADLLACVWTQRADAPHVQRVVPDGCVDVVWVAGRELVVAGPATGVALVALPGGSETVGLRFRPGAAPAGLAVAADALRDATPPLVALWGRSRAGRLADALAAAGGDPARQLALLAGALQRARADAPAADPLVLAAAAAVARRVPAPRVRDLAASLGVSERQLLRRVRAGVGYGPKTLARVVRLQRFLAAARAQEPPRRDLARLAQDAGYADQPHLARECRRLAGAAPGRLLAAS